ncbi:MAG: hypothetical protein EPN41_13180 [Candidimonas sp.]|nr:MAG: hypothetical protein EPN41_13180 [Candidimonas sp.]
MRKDDTGGVGIKSLETGYRLLEVLADSMPIGLGKLASKGRISASRACKYLASFQRVGLVKQDPETHLYSLGDAALRLGCLAAAHNDDFRKLQQIQAKLRDDTAQTVVLSLWTDRGPMIANIEMGLSPVVATMKLGTLLPLTSSAAGKTFASWLPQNLVRPFVTAELAATQRNSADGAAESTHDAFFELLQAVRDRGIEHRYNSMLTHINAIAAPFFDRGARLVGVLSIIGDENLIDITYDGRLAQALRDAQNVFRDERKG